MKFKKLLAVGIILGAASLPLVANADLTISNNTDQWSSVKINGNCSGPTFATAPHQSPNYPTMVVSGLCSFTNPCKAEIYASKTCEGGTFVGTAQIDIHTDVVSNVTVSNPHYTVIAEGAHVSLNAVG